MARARYVQEYEIRSRATVARQPAAPLVTPQQAAAVFAPLSEGAIVESFRVAYLDGRHRLLGVAEVARGAANVVNLSARDLFRGAIVAGAVAILVAHNHPSGDAGPSEADMELTRRIIAAGDVLGVPVLDHIVTGDRQFYSFTSARIYRDE